MITVILNLGMTLHINFIIKTISPEKYIKIMMNML